MKRLLKYYILLLLLFSISIYANGSNQSIILTHQDQEESIIEKKRELDQLILNNKTLKKFSENKKLVTSIEKKSSQYILKIDSFDDSSSLAISYLILRESFPQAFIIENSVQEPKLEKVVENIVVESSDDRLLWIAIFSLALIGILALFISSREIKNINKKYEKMQERQHTMELFFTKMSESIYNLTREAIKNEDEKRENSSQKELPNLNKVKNKLFDETRMMIYFMRLKSKKINIVQESFNINTMMSNILGTLSSNFKESKTELIFDIDHSVPKILSSDLLHLSEILIELLQNSMQNTVDGEVILKVFIKSKNRLTFQIIDTGTNINYDKLETLFIPTYTQDGEYKGIGLYVANELTTMMNGELTIDDTKRGKFAISCTIPLMQSNSKEKRKYRLPDRSYVRKKVLLCEDNPNAAKAIEKMLNYFRYDVEITSHKELISERENLSRFDIIMGDIDRFNSKDIELVKTIREDHPLKIVHLSSIFSAKQIESQEYIDEYLKKPLSQERLCDLIITLFGKEGERVATVAKAKNRVESLKVVYPNDIKRTENIAADSFKVFKGSHLLIVEDSFIDQKLLQNIFEKAGIKVTTANNGKEALEKLKIKDIKYNLIFMDISMPIMDGYDAIAQIRENSKYDHIPVVASTSMTLESEINKMFLSGANAYLGKPLNIGYLYSILDNFISESKSDKVENKKVQKKPLKSINGLDFRKGIQHANSSEELYKEVLNEFILAYGESDETIRRMINENRYQQAKRLCLDMKGITAAIGAYEMFDIVDAMHKQYIYNNLHLIPKFVDTYHDGLVKLLVAIEHYKSES